MRSENQDLSPVIQGFLQLKTPELTGPWGLSLLCGPPRPLYPDSARGASPALDSPPLSGLGLLSPQSKRLQKRSVTRTSQRANSTDH